MISGIYQCVSISMWFVLRFLLSACCSFFFALGFYPLQSNEMAFNFRCVCLYLFLCSSFPHKQNLSCAILMAFLAAHNIQPICMDAAYPTLIHCKRLKLHTNKRNIPIKACVCILIAHCSDERHTNSAWNLKCLEVQQPVHEHTILILIDVDVFWLLCCCRDFLFSFFFVQFNSYFIIQVRRLLSCAQQFIIWFDLVHSCFGSSCVVERLPSSTFGPFIYAVYFRLFAWFQTICFILVLSMCITCICNLHSCLSSVFKSVLKRPHEEETKIKK